MPTPMENEELASGEAARPARVMVLGDKAATINARLLDLSGRWMKLLVSMPIDLGAALGVEVENTLYLGEVCLCQPARGGFDLGVGLHEVLFNVDKWTRRFKTVGH